MPRRKRTEEDLTPKQKLMLDLYREYPGAPKKTLARLAHKLHPIEFRTVNSARGCLQSLTKSGNKRDPYVVDDKRTSTSFKIPEPVQPKNREVTIPNGKYLILSDLHIPYHNKVSIESAINHGLSESCTGLYLNGDGVDFYKLSRWEKDPRARNTLEELEMLWEVLDSIKSLFSTRFYKIGNHEDRLSRAVWTSLPELAILPEFNLDKVLKLEEREFQLVDSKQYANFGGLLGFHGHELPRGLTNPVNIGRGLCLRVRQSCFAGHWHTSSTHNEPKGIDKSDTVPYWSIGCLCDMSPDYAIVNKWNQGFAICEVADNEFNFENFTVSLKGKVRKA